MARNIYSPIVTDAEQCLPINLGGTSVDTVAEIPTALNLALQSQKGVALGLVPLDGNGKVPLSYFPGSGLGNPVSVDGTVSVTVTTSTVFQITDYDSFKSYTVTSTRGTVSQANANITYTAPLTAGADAIIVNGRSIPLTVISAIPSAPNVVTPTEADQTINSSATFVSGGFSLNVGEVSDIHESSDWQLATDVGFTAISKSVTANTTYRTYWDVTNLAPNTTYYLRVRHKGVNNGYGPWSATRSMKTLVNFVANTPSITSPVEAAAGVLLAPTFSSSAFASSVVGDTHQFSDWQVATDSGFVTVVKSTANDAVNKTSWSTSGLLDGTLYYLRVRHKGNNTVFSAWSTTVSFTTAVANTITAPSATFSPVVSNGTLSTTNGVTGSAFTVSGGSDTHLNTDWQIASDAGFTTIVTQLMASTSNKTTWNFTGLTNGVQYYFRFRYRGNVLAASPWSNTTSFRAYFVNGAAVTSPVSGTNNLNPDSVTFTSAAFSVSGGSDSHSSSDWQVATDVGFTNIVKSTTADAVNKTTWTTTGLSLNATYYVRVRHRGTAFGIGDWGPTSNFITFTQYTVATPSITAPTNGATAISKTYAFTGNAFSKNGGTDTHASSDWQIASDSGFTTIIASTTNDATNKTGWTGTLAKGNTIYYVRVRYKGSTIGYSAWSATVSFTTGTFNAIAPTITSPGNGSTGIALAPTFNTSAFASDDTVDVHQLTDWQVATDAGFTVVVKSSLNDSVNKTTWSTSGLTDGTVYYVRSRHKGTLSNWSNYSPTVSFTTAVVNTVNAPSILSYSPVAINGTLSLNTIATSSIFSVTGGSDTHYSTDWQIATDSNFTNIVGSVTNSTSDKTTWTFSGLGYRQTYYVRLRHKGNILPYSAWSTPVTISTYRTNTPTLTQPSDGATGVGIYNPLLTTSAFSTSTNSSSHSSTLWEISLDGYWGAPLWSVDSTSNKTAINIPLTLGFDTLYYVRVRHVSDIYGPSAFTETTFRTLAMYVPDTPSVTSPTNGATEIAETYNFTSTGFSITGTDTHSSTSWQIATDNGFTNVVVSSNDDVSNKLTWNVSLPSPNTTYYIRLRHRSSGNAYSLWSPVVSFTTKPAFMAYSEVQRFTYSTYYDFTHKTGIKISGDGMSGVACSYAESMDSSVCPLVNTGGTWGAWQSFGDNIALRIRRASGGIDISDNGKTIVAGCMPDGAGYNNGSVAVFRTSSASNSWHSSFVTTDTLYYPIGGQNFGYRVAISGDGQILAIANQSSGGYSSVCTYKLDVNGITWVYIDVLTRTQTGTSDEFGESLALNYDGTVLAVGSPGGVSPGNVVTGWVHVFNRTGLTWTESQVFKGTNQVAGDRFGASVDVSSDGSTIVVGAPGWNENFTDQGKIYAFTKVGVNPWTETFSATSYYNKASGNFGASVSVSSNGKRIVASAPGEVNDGMGTIRPGVFYGYSLNSNGSLQASYYKTPSDIASITYSCSQVSLSNDGYKMLVTGTDASPTTHHAYYFN